MFRVPLFRTTDIHRRKEQLAQLLGIEIVFLINLQCLLVYF